MLISTTISLTEECRKCVDAARGTQELSEFVESILWSHARIKRAAKRTGHKKVARDRPGRRWGNKAESRIKRAASE